MTTLNEGEDEEEGAEGDSLEDDSDEEDDDAPGRFTLTTSVVMVEAGQV